MVERRELRFEVDGDEVVGVVRIPATSKRIGVVLEGPLTSVKEQVTGNYADALAHRGFVALAFDHRFFGESGGEPRQLEWPAKKIEDVRAAVGALAALDEVDDHRIAAVGVCAGAGYMARAVAGDPRVRAFAAVAGFFHDAAKQREWMGDDGLAEALAEAVSAREHYEQTGEVRSIPAVGREGRVAMPLDDAYEYYATRGDVANYTNEFALMSREHTLRFDAQGAAADITVPTLMIHSEAALAPALARAFFANLGGIKREEWLESTSQTDFYDNPALVEPAADRITRHFERFVDA